MMNPNQLLHHTMGLSPMRFVLFVSAFTLFFSAHLVWAAEMRQHGAHVHGVGSLNVILHGPELVIELETPAANITGFEHAPENEQQEKQLGDAIATLKRGNKLFAFSGGGSCKLQEAEVGTDMEKGHDHHGHDEPAPKKHDEDVHKDHEHHHDEAGKHEEHEHEAHGHDHEAVHSHDEHDHHDESGEHEGHGHSDFTAHYHFICEKPEKLRGIDVLLFKYFKGFERIEVQLMAPGKQTAVELKPGKSKISL
jgi:hypothetical protein